MHCVIIQYSLFFLEHKIMVYLNIYDMLDLMKYGISYFILNNPILSDLIIQ